MKDDPISDFKKQLADAETKYQEELKKYELAEKNFVLAAEHLQRVSEEYWNYRLSQRQKEFISKIKKILRLK